VAKSRLALIALLVVATSAAAYHRQTPPIVPITDSGDTLLPRLPSPGRRLTVALPVNGQSGLQIFRQNRADNFLEQLSTEGDNRNPTISGSGTVVAWDSDCGALVDCTDPGRQIFMWELGNIVQVTHDSTGTSINPEMNGQGARIAFESHGDLDPGQNPTGASQIFMRQHNGSIQQMSSGQGTSRNVAISRSGRTLAYESTNGPNGTDTGVFQIWLSPAPGLSVQITHGQVASLAPDVSQEGRVLVFQSTAALTSDGHDTHIPQIFSYEIVPQRLRQVTNDPQGCTGPSVNKLASDWRIGYVCHGQGFFFLLAASKQHQLPINSGDTVQSVAELGGHFMMVSTTANLATGTGTTSGHQLYMLNLFKLLPGVP